MVIIIQFLAVVPFNFVGYICLTLCQWYIMKREGIHLQRDEQIKNLNLTYKIIHNDTPSYLPDLLPNRVNEAVTYDLENHQNFQVPFSRLCSFDSSFFTSTFRLWNGLDLSLRNSATLLEFKTKLRNQAQKDKTSDILSISEKKTNN